MRKATLSISLTVIFLTIGWLFWYQEGQYLLPTPLPETYTPVLTGTSISPDSTMMPAVTSPTLLHFFNPDCPCSRFNLKHFVTLTEKYKSIQFFAVVTDDEKASSAKSMLGPHVSIIVDHDEKLAKKCGVYSTPQAAILTSASTLFYRGNYNRARYCTDKNSNFVQMALDSLAANTQPPTFNAFATNAYGCTLPGNQTLSLIP